MSFDFSEPMTGFEQGDVTVSNGSVTAFSGSGRSYTATIAPAGAGTVTVDVAAHVAMDATGNPNMPAKRFSVRAEPASPNAPPVITDPGDKTYEQGEAITAFGITATDADSDPLTVTLSGLPSGLSYANDQVQGTVAADVAAKIYTVTISADDGVNEAVTATFTITVTPPAPPAVTIADASAGEGDPITFTVTLDKAVSGGLTVTPSFTDGTAEKGTDYSENTAALTFTGTAGETQSFTVETVEDEVTEEDETFTVSLTVSGTSATVTATDTATGTRPEKDPSKPLSRLKSPGSQYPAKSMNRGLVVGLGLRLLPGGVVLEIRSDENQHPHLLADPL
ncbi:MAG: Ig-like domain-containing protein [Bryobacterales bacterium]|nr:Ig-like domain-containing protein [Bryobacterales bacterium]